MRVRRHPTAHADCSLRLLLLCRQFIFFNVFASLLTNALGFFIPAYYSMKALQTPGNDDDTQWLTYWSVYGFFAVLETVSDHVLYWFPFYYTAKAILLVWLMLPATQGAKIVYANVLRPLFFHTPAGTVPKGFNEGSDSGLFSETTAKTAAPAASASTSASAAPPAGPTPAAAAGAGAAPAPAYQASAPTGHSSALPPFHAQAAPQAAAPSAGGVDFSSLASNLGHAAQGAGGAGGAGGFELPPEAQQALHFAQTHGGQALGSSGAHVPEGLESTLQSSGLRF